ncbi:ThuA domain-containing protein [Streptomyces sp. NPDC058464]|uniref:ThuA domain-containing protein n=1 Tax=Streptomyces sp. NPDC058464 TaxID=3346511 RepID=UPI00365E9230
MRTIEEPALNSHRVVVFTRTLGYRHESIESAVALLVRMGEAQGWTVCPTENPDELSSLLPDADTVVFASTSGEVLTSEARDLLVEHVSRGGGFAGVHAAACTEYAWPYYGRLVGARFAGHPPYQRGTVLVEDQDHPATEHLPRVWDFEDEWYDFDVSPRAHVRVLASADESTYAGGGMGHDHPLAWCHDSCGGRVFYTALGHAVEAYADPDFQAHLMGGLRYTLGLAG